MSIIRFSRPAVNARAVRRLMPHSEFSSTELSGNVEERYALAHQRNEHGGDFMLEPAASGLASGGGEAHAD